MFSLFAKKSPSGTTTVFAIDGMHCTSCSLVIDGELEDIPGVIEATTNYSQAKTTVLFDAQRVTKEKIKEVIQKLGYTAHEK